MKCRNCAQKVSLELIDLGSAPLSNSYLTVTTLRRPERWFPLRVMICNNCWLVQAEAYSRSAEIFSEDYAYFSSFSSEWLVHAQILCERMTSRLGLGDHSFVVEIGSNDGYLLRNFVRSGVPCLGIEPTASTAAAAKLLGVPTLERFFDEELATEVLDTHGPADLIVAINVFAHVPYPRDVLRAVRTLLAPNGVFLVEFPQLRTLIESCEFDTIYHEHFSYFSFTTVHQMMTEARLRVVEVEELSTHGGSLRVVAERDDSSPKGVHSSVSSLLQNETDAGINSIEYYRSFKEEAIHTKNELIRFLLLQKTLGKQVVGYGAAAKGNTILNFAGIRSDLLPYVVDRNPAKIGKYLPGSRIPILSPDVLRENKPDIILILPWNLTHEIEAQLSYIRDWGGKFAVAIPAIRCW